MNCRRRCRKRGKRSTKKSVARLEKRRAFSKNMRAIRKIGAKKLSPAEKQALRGVKKPWTKKRFVLPKDPVRRARAIRHKKTKAWARKRIARRAKVVTDRKAAKAKKIADYNAKIKAAVKKKAKKAAKAAKEAGK